MKVAIRCTAVPDGTAGLVRADGALKARLRLSLILEPLEASAFELADWCDTILASSFTVEILKPDQTQSFAKAGLTDRYSKRDLGLPVGAKTRLKNARDRMFAELLSDAPEQPGTTYDGLMNALKAKDQKADVGDKGKSEPFLLTSGSAPVDLRKVRFSSLGRIGREVRRAITEETTRSLLLGAVQDNKKAKTGIQRLLVQDHDNRDRIAEQGRVVGRVLANPEQWTARLDRWRTLHTTFVAAPRPAVSRPLPGVNSPEGDTKDPLDLFYEERQNDLIGLGTRLYHSDTGLGERVLNALSDLLPSSSQTVQWSPLGFEAEQSTTQDAAHRIRAILKLPEDQEYLGTKSVGAAELAIRAFDDARAAPAIDSNVVDAARRVLNKLGPDETCASETSIERATRRLAELHSHPTLMRFLQFMADIEVDVDISKLERASDGRFYGYIQARADANAASGDIATAFVLSLEQESLQFEPCPEHAWPASASKAKTLRQIFPIDEGFIDLRIAGPVQDGAESSNRFRLSTTDATAALSTIRSQAGAATSSEDAGSPSVKGAAGWPELRSRGIAILDRGADVQHTITLLRTGLREQAGSLSQPLFAEDLVSGFRLDIVHDGSLPVAYPAGARDLVYPDINRAYGKDVPGPNDPEEGDKLWHPYPDFAHRDDGFILPSSKEKPEPPKKDSAGNAVVQPAVVLPSETVVTWSGYNVGLPSFQDPDLSDDAGCKISVPLPVEVQYRLPADRLGPSLRTARPYRAMLRTRKVNGASVEPAQSDYLIDRYGLGGGSDRVIHPRDDYYWFMRPERIGAPAVLLETDDPLIQESSDDTRNESDSSVVIRDGQSRAARRILVAPRTDFDSCEQAGLFDGNPDRCEGIYRRLDLNERGAFPDAVRRGTKPPKGTVGQLYSPGGEEGRALPYFADPSAREVAARLRLKDGRQIAWLSADGLPAFWDNELDDDQARPIILEVRTAQAGSSRMVVDRADLDPFDTVHRLTIALAPADELELELWPLIDGSERQHRLLLSEGMQTAEEALEDILGEKMTFDRETLRRLGARQPLDQLVASRLLTVTHAVKRPLFVPSFVFDGGRALNLVRLSSDPKEGIWEDMVHMCLEETGRLDFCSFRPDSPMSSGKPEGRPKLPIGGSLAYIAGQIRCHRPSTDTVRCEVAWKDYASSAALRMLDSKKETPADNKTSDLFAPEGDGSFEFNPRTRFGDLFKLTNLPRQDRLGDQNLVDLVYDEAGHLRSLLAGFDSKDGKARRLALRLIGTSRFTNAYPEVNAGQMEKEFGVESATRDQMAATLDFATGKPSLGSPIVWLDATIRPELPRVTRTTSFMPTTIARPTEGSVEVYRRVTTRIHLGKEWFSSGEGELLGIVCVPNDVLDDERPGRDPKLGGRYPAAGSHSTPGESWRRKTLQRLSPADEWWSSHWGMDPTTLSLPMIPAVIPPEAFSGYAWKLPNQALWARRNKNEKEESHSVSLFLFEPRFDTTRGEWFVDLDINTGLVKSPFARLVLVRYQPHAIYDESKDFRLSEPTILDDFKLYSPCKVNVERRNRMLHVEVRAPTFTERAPAIICLAQKLREKGVDLARRGQTPSYKIEVALSGRNGRTSLLFGEDCRPVETMISDPDTDESGRPVWRADLELPATADDRELMVTVEEHEAHIDSRAVFDPGFTADVETVIKSPTPVSVTI